MSAYASAAANPAMNQIEYGISPFTVIHRNSKAISAHRNIVYQPWAAQLVPIQATYDEKITCSAFFSSIYQLTPVKETKTGPSPHRNQGTTPQAVSETDSLLMTGIVGIPDPYKERRMFPEAHLPQMPPLRRCSSALEFLKAVYDLLEVKQGPLPRGWETESDGPYRPKLAHQALRYDEPLEKSKFIESVAMPFDSAFQDIAEYRQMSAYARGFQESLTDRPGVAGSISRAVSTGYFMSGPRHPAPMPEFFNTRAAAAYHAMHDDTDPARFTYTHAHVPGSLKAVADLSAERCFFQPRHGAESIFWLIVSHFLRSIPVEFSARATSAEMNNASGPSINNLPQTPQSQLERPNHNSDAYVAQVIPQGMFDPDPVAERSKKEPMIPDNSSHLALFAKYNAILQNHTVPRQPTPNVADTRQIFFTELNTVEKWAAVLHPGLQALAPMMARLTVFVAPEYEYLSLARDKGVAMGGTVPIGMGGGELPMDHLHEGMQRIILDQMFNMLDAGDGAEIPMHRWLERGDANLDAASDREAWSAFTLIPRRDESDARKPYWARWVAELARQEDERADDEDEPLLEQEDAELGRDRDVEMDGDDGEDQKTKDGLLLGVDTE
ncbi:hypothetical protein DL93DRAFT_2164132 [Clavulina sp. PMI_390]|nr:hypothetical protein DL93DRAFT_2164132 [Clavulina sp. PMI_390]